MDGKTREKAIRKAKALRTHVGYQSNLKEWLKLLEQDYKNLEMQPDDYLSNTLRLEALNREYLFEILREPIDKNESDFVMNPVDVDALYAFTENAIRTYLFKCNKKTSFTDWHLQIIHSISRCNSAESVFLPGSSKLHELCEHWKSYRTRNYAWFR